MPSISLIPYCVWLAQSTDFDMQTFFDDLRAFFRTFFDDVMDNDLRGLILYLWGCFPPFLRTFLLIGVTCALLAAFLRVFRKD